MTFNPLSPGPRTLAAFVGASTKRFDQLHNALLIVVLLRTVDSTPEVEFLSTERYTIDSATHDDSTAH